MQGCEMEEGSEMQGSEMEGSEMQGSEMQGSERDVMLRIAKANTLNYTKS
jgi:hypothetical protein